MHPSHDLIQREFASDRETVRCLAVGDAHAVNAIAGGLAGAADFFAHDIQYSETSGDQLDNCDKSPQVGSTFNDALGAIETGAESNLATARR